MSSSLTHNVNYVHIDDEVFETTLAISSLQKGKDLSDPFKDHPFHHVPIDEETPIALEQDSDSKDEEEQTKDVMDIMWPISQSFSHVSCLFSLKLYLFILILV